VPRLSHSPEQVTTNAARLDGEAADLLRHDARLSWYVHIHRAPKNRAG
jgi:hypothetical protein